MRKKNTSTQVLWRMRNNKCKMIFDRTETTYTLDRAHTHTFTYEAIYNYTKCIAIKRVVYRIKIYHFVCCC